ncbi:hypothetical protein A3A76_00625 [Candidatus Woesebacteria bacterium RIFCSPLOWO2_01_FULL_39_23]|uniref:GIY-YIG domain-containing protein n=1 Tax=Candidatus Woesebacteria bacterium RIFCSPHIGHO2_01_FULL_40_22 TaxID=1802499 RepID=A0A1F7YJZ7_9BACT|nr:MAG: hypothetical protein A2141_05755 [Candidatus Woesebacteria bacterium RBG_16_40_11]OGM27199.1 MAG: hypothetical protein A2628_04145 [Candidatus Woesebacteria bacterium RIFCSPHIGHO2_01_FULL_40_22]OGM63364.1 MAG: hypothetical protein A3A76_00625 [Candidatus Woesebacteria bacterium RIFCSPLOWO2_01_FULL_39_23]
MYYFYILKSNKLKSCYYGFTNDLRRRFKEHNQGLSAYTKNGRPWKIAYYEAFSNKADAFEREKQMKRRKNSYTLLRRRIIRSIEF